MASKDQPTVFSYTRLCRVESNGIYCIYQFCPPAKSRCNNTAIAIGWVMLSIRDRLNLGDGFKGKGGACSMWESELPCWKSHVNENTILGRWLVLKSILYSSQDFSHFHFFLTLFTFCLFSLAASFFGFVEKPCQMVTTAPCTLRGCFSSPPLFFSSSADLHCWFSTSNAWCGTNVQNPSSLFPNSLSSSHSSPLSVYTGICIKKIHFGMANPTTFDLCGWVMASICALLHICVKNNLRNSVCQWDKSDRKCFAGLMHILSGGPWCACRSIYPCLPVFCAMSDDVFIPQSSPFKNLLIRYPEMWKNKNKLHIKWWSMIFVLGNYLLFVFMR